MITDGLVRKRSMKVWWIPKIKEVFDERVTDGEQYLYYV